MAQRWYQKASVQAAIVGGVFLVIVALIGLWRPNSSHEPVGTGIYRVRVTVLDSGQTPIEDAKVWSTMPGEPQKVAGGWEFNIPAQSRPADGKLMIFASRPSAFLKGEADLQLEKDFNPTVVVHLRKDTSASVTGMVQDSDGKAVAGCRVTAVGSSLSMLTAGDGRFVLDLGAAQGQSVLLHVEKSGYAAQSQYHLAGEEPAVIVLDREQQ